MINFLLASCASFLNPRYPEVSISTSPQDAYIYIDQWVAITPVKLTINSEAKSILVKKEGYKQKEFLIRKGTRYTQVYLGNLFWLPIYPVAVWLDYANGTAYDIEKNINIDLEKDQ
jgi:hypothetical protein